MFNLHYYRKIIIILNNLLRIIFILISVILMLIQLNLIILNKLNIFNISIVVLLLYVVNLFSYFFSIYQNSKYTSSIKFFWIRVFNLVWFLEFYLFIVCIFIYIISPSELKIFIDTSHQLKPELPNIQSINGYIIIILSILSLNYIGYYCVYSNIIIRNVLLLLLTITLIILFTNELKLYYYYLHISNFKDIKLKKTIDYTINNEIYVINTNINTHNIYSRYIDSDRRYYPPYVFIMNIILGVKFLHIYLIVLINLIYIYILTTTRRYIILEIIGLWQQNLIIVLIFWSLNYLIFFKFFYKSYVYGFYRNINFYDILTNYNAIIEEFFII